MPFCPSCGSPAEGRFCPKCGAAISAGDDATRAASIPPGSASTTPAGLTENVASALCYVLGLITGILFLVQNRTIRFHAFQSIFLQVAAIIVWIIFFVVSSISGGFLFLISPLIWLGFFVLWLVVIIKAYQNQKLVIPVIGPLAEKQA